MGVEPPGEDPPEESRPPAADEVPGLFGVKRRIVVGVFFFALYAFSWSIRGDIAAGLVGGALGGLLFYLVLKERDERRLRRHRSDPRR